MNAIWDVYYDYRIDKLYNRPCCPECREPIGLHDDGNYRCFSCGEIVEVTDQNMIEWIKLRSEIKAKCENCRRCGKNAQKFTYSRNPVTLEWQAVMGECSNCGVRWIE